MIRNCSLTLLLILLSAANARCQNLIIETMEFGTGIENRQLTGIDTAFVDNVSQIYCYTRITGATDTAKITHVWYHRDEEKARITLDVESDNWRTWSSKRISSEWKGPWRVMVLSENGEVLSNKMFKIIASNE